MSSTAYTILGVHSDSTDEEIKNAYRILIKSTHPDNYCGHDVPRHIVGIFQQVHSAYGLLMDPKRRAALDERLESAKPRGQPKQSGLGFHVDVLG